MAMGHGHGLEAGCEGTGCIDMVYEQGVYGHGSWAGCIHRVCIDRMYRQSEWT